MADRQEFRGQVDFVGSIGKLADPLTITAHTDSTLTAEAGKEYVLDRAAGVNVTLPTPTVGARISFVVKTTVTSNTHTFTTPAGTALVGYLKMLDVDGTVAMKYFESDGSDRIINLNGTTKGGILGDTISFVGTATGWNVRGDLSGTGTTTNPFE